MPTKTVDPLHAKVSNVYTGVEAAALTAMTMRKYILSNREVEVLRMLANGFTSERIGRALHISKDTVDTHRKSITRKFGVTNIVAAVAFAFRHQLLQ